MDKVSSCCQSKYASQGEDQIFCGQCNNPCSVVEKKEERKATKILLQYNDGTLKDITDLPKLEYEEFLEAMKKLRLLYISMTSR